MTRFYSMAIFNLPFLLFAIPATFKRVDIPDCGGTGMTIYLRGFMLDQHNYVRSTVAKGNFPKENGRHWPSAANMYKM
ncbi:hypothetical protein DICVIV_11941, partial [Dictyocaulus viviparus]